MYMEFTFESLFGQISRRILAAITIFLFTFTFYSPGVHAGYELLSKGTLEPQNKLSTYSPLGYDLEQLKRYASRIKGLINSPELEKKQHKSIKAALEGLNSLIPQLEERDQEMQEILTDEVAHLTRNGIPEYVKNRQKEFNGKYRENMNIVISTAKELASLEFDSNDTTVVNQQLDILLDILKHPLGTPSQSFSSDLDFVDAPPRPIYTNLNQIQSLLNSDGSELPIDDYLETDVATQSTDKIKDLVYALGADPLSLFNWVYDEIRFIPSYGLMQGADYTLKSKQGNAFDIASTLVALYREAGIPAKYRYGIVSIPEEHVRNWVGGVSNVDAATNLLSQGGIPQKQIGYGGAIEEVELEHVWVEAYVDGKWIQLDPSFKQYDYKEGMDVEAIVPMDVNSLITDLEATATRNEEEGWIQGVDQSIVLEALNDYQNELQTYFDSHAPNATLEEVIGSQTIISSNATSLSDVTLPYQRIVASESVPQLPNSLYHKFQLQIGATTGGTFGLPIQWSGLLAEVSEPTASLVGKSIAISFKPASDADAQALTSYMPESPESVEDLPDSLPASSIRMVGEITIDGEPVSATNEVTLGQALMTRLGYIPPQRGWNYSENNLIAGTYQAVGIDMQGISPSQMQALMSRLDNTKNVLDTKDENQYQGLSKHDLVGNLLQTGIQSYLAETYAMDKLAARASDVVHYRSPSYGTFSTNLEVSYLFGTPSRVHYTGVVMDVDRITGNSESEDNCYEDWLKFNRSSGMRGSLYEHMIPERIFSTDENPAEAVSTSKALNLAISEGQRIYTLDQSNAEQLQYITIDDGARSEIQEALNLGLEVTVHEKPIEVNGWKGSGYSIVDPEYGVGAYKISGGTNGGILIVLGITFLLMFMISMFIMGPHMWAFLLTPSGQLIVGAVISSAVALIARGVELLTDNYGNACGWANGGIGAGIGALLSLWLPIIPIVGILVGITLSGILPCI